MVIWTSPLAWARGPRPSRANGCTLARPPGPGLLGAGLCPDPNQGGVSAVSKDGCLDRAEIPNRETLCGDLTPLCARAESKGGWER